MTAAATLAVRRSLQLAAALLIILSVASPSAAQGDDTVQVMRSTPVLERPRGDAFVLGSVQAGDVVQIVDQQGAWYLITAPSERAASLSWKRGWIRADALNPDDRPTITTPGARARAAAPRPPGRTSIRGFGQFGGIAFMARDSFDAVLDGSFGLLYGAGGQFLFPSGAFIQGSFERFTQDGFRVLVAGDQLFQLPIPTKISVTPIQVTFGYRPVPRGATASYVGVGAGVYRFREETPALDDADAFEGNHFSFHLLGGVEYRVMPWVALAGEVQWTGVPKAIGDDGVSAVFDEKDLGGTTVRLKIVVGR